MRYIAILMLQEKLDAIVGIGVIHFEAKTQHRDWFLVTCICIKMYDHRYPLLHLVPLLMVARLSNHRDPLLHVQSLGTLPQPRANSQSDDRGLPSLLDHNHAILMLQEKFDAIVGIDVIHF